MPYVTRVEVVGNLVSVVYDDGSRQFAYPSGSGVYVVTTAIDSSTTSTTPSAPPDPAATGTIYNPWKNYSISGTWQDHMSYSLGGIDYPLSYGTNIAAPSSGTLHTSGGSGEYAAGWVGTAGRRSILYLDADIPRVAGRALEQGEGTGPMHAIVFQHQSKFGTNGKHYNQGDICGVSGASASGSDYGGDVHLHVHGLTADGTRVDFLNFIP